MKRNGTKLNGKDRRSMYSSVRSMIRLQGRLVIKPGTERNEMERNETEKSVKSVDSATSGPDEARRTAGRQARHRVHFS